MSKLYSHTAYCSLSYNGEVYAGMEDLLMLAADLQESSDKELRQLSIFLAQWCNNSPFIELQTSGSTGKPKLIRVRKSAMLASADRTIRFLNLQQGDSVLLCLSVKYIAGKMMVVRAMLGNLKLIQGSVTSNPLVFIDQTIDFTAMVPLQVASIINDDRALFSKVKKLIIGGGKVDDDLASEIVQLGINAWESYGMTETVSHIALRKIEDVGSPFSLLPEIKISQDQRGCIVIKPSSINENELFTNDIIELISDHEFVLKGRFDNVINTGGIKVFPEEVERKLNMYIPQSFIISSLPDLKLGNRIVLVIEGDKDGCMELEEAFSQLTAFEKPKEIRFISKFPMTETGKIQRLKIQQLL